jgi:hypothetical protein
MLLELNQAGNFRAARAAPGGPEIKKNNFPTIGIELQWFSIEIF